MEPMVHFKLILLAFACALAEYLCHARNEYCAFALAISHPDGSPAAGVNVAVRPMYGVAAAEVTSSPDRLARLCDAPLGLLSISIGINRCGSMSINFLQRPAWETHKLKLI